MYFKTYAPTTRSENCEKARAGKKYNAVKNYSGHDKPTKHDYFNYCYDYASASMQRKLENMTDEELEYWAEQRTHEWKNIVNLVASFGQPLRNQYVAYFGIIDGGVKCGQTEDIIIRYGDINRKTPIHQKLWYIEVENREQALAAETALHNLFDHARCMSRAQSKQDYYNCNEEQAQKFFTANKKKIYNAIMEAIEGI